MSALERFAREHQAYHGVSQDRCRMQRRVLTALAESAGKDLELIEPDDLQAYLATRIEEGMAPSTVGKELSAIRPFYSWARKVGLVDAERLLDLGAIGPPRGSRPKPKPYKPEQIQKFWRDLAAAYPWAHDQDDEERGRMYFERWLRGTSRWPRAMPYARRCQIEAIASLAVYGGLRRDEIFHLLVDDLHPENDYVAVKSARKNPDAEENDRAVPWMTPEMHANVARWIDVRARVGPPHDHAWLSLWYGVNNVKELRHRAFEMLLSDFGWEFHRMRHTAATAWLRAGMPLERVSRILGHRKIQQTQAYTEFVHTDAVDAANRTSARVSRALAPQELAA